MKIGVVSDTHINDKNQDLPLKLIEALRGVDMIIHAGDILQLDVLDKLRAICPEVKAVHGNMDTDETKWKLPQKEVFSIGRFKIALIHGWGPPATMPELVFNEFRREKPDIIVFGHTHNPMNERYQGVLMFNPGSATDKIYAKFNSCGIIEINDKIEARIIKI